MACNIINQDNLRESFKSFLEETGIKQKYISKKLNINETALCHFKKGRQVLNDKQYIVLMSFLIQNK